MPLSHDLDICFQYLTLTLDLELHRNTLIPRVTTLCIIMLINLSPSDDLICPIQVHTNVNKQITINNGMTFYNQFSFERIIIVQGLSTKFPLNYQNRSMCML